MIRCFVTGDNHFGRKYDSFGEAKDTLIEDRYKSFDQMVRKANDEKCDLFFITGDLFEKADLDYIGGKQIFERIIKMLSKFNSTVFIIPGNHDFYAGGLDFWSEFIKIRDDGNVNNIVVLNEWKPYETSIRGERVVIYPAYCQSEHSDVNNLKWIKDSKIDTDDAINIGLAHGTLEDLSCDNEGVYFYMSKAELNDIPVDAWFLGHAHTSYPGNIGYDYSEVGKIFNPGTHQQTHIANNTEGNCFIVEIEQTGSGKKVRAKKVRSGIDRFYLVKVNVNPDSDDSLKNAIDNEVKNLAKEDGFDKSRSVIRLVPSGVVRPSEYEIRDEIFEKATEGFLGRYECSWSDLIELIKPDQIDREFSEKSFISRFLHRFDDVSDTEEESFTNRKELSMAYKVIKEIQAGKKTKGKRK